MTNLLSPAPMFLMLMTLISVSIVVACILSVVRNADRYDIALKVYEEYQRQGFIAEYTFSMWCVNRRRK